MGRLPLKNLGRAADAPALGPTLVMPLMVGLLVLTGRSLAGPLQPRAQVSKPAQAHVDIAWHRSDVITVKFRDGLLIRLRDGLLTDMGTGDLAGTAAFLHSVAGGEWKKIHSLPEAKVDLLRETAQNNLGRVVADLNLEFFFVLPEGADAAASIDAFNRLDAVELASPVQLAPPLPFPPDFKPDQGYLDPATDGVDAECMWLVPGGTGTGIQVADLEYNWNLNHLDLIATLLGPPPTDPFNDDNHGTAVLGAIGGLDNGWGVTGIAHDATFFVAAANVFFNYNLTGAIITALGTLVEGDVLIIEQQTVGPNFQGGSQFGLVPSEWVLSVYNAVVLAVGNGVIVVEAAGNGAQNLDDPVYSQGNFGHWPFLPENDSGAIIVGAGVAPASFDVDRSRLGFSNYGSTVDLQGWGNAVVTAGYGSLYNAEGQNLLYTAFFSGTSSASPIVAGACVVLQSAYETLTGTLLTPAQVADFLKATGSPQQDGSNPATENIGPRPDAAAALCVAFPSIDVNGNLVPDPCEQLVNNITQGTFYNSIQPAINDAVNGDEIVVPRGIYLESINFLGKAITLRSSDGPFVTTIDGTGSFHVVQCVSGEGPETVIEGFTITHGNANGAFPDSAGGGMYNSGSNPTVTDCTFIANTAVFGSGMFNEVSNPTVTGCTFVGNYDSLLGGGMSNSGSDPVVANCTFSGNSAIAGSGMDNFDSSPTITDCTFSGNTAEATGGGIHNQHGSNPTVTDCEFNGNTAGTEGGGIWNDSSSSPTVANCTFGGNSAQDGAGMFNGGASPTVINCTFSENAAGGTGGGIHNSAGSPALTNCTFVANTAGENGGGVFNTSAGPTVTNCILWHNDPDEIFGPASVAYSDVEHGFPGPGNIDADPMLVETGSDCCVPHGGPGCDDPGCRALVCDVNPFCCFVWDQNCADNAVVLCPDLCPPTDDFRLLPGSPCIDAGDNSAVPADITTDLDGNPRFLEIPETPDTGNGTLPIVDMGAYESLGGGCLAVTTQDIVCHADGTTFTVNIEGLNACTGGTTQVTFTASGGAVGEELCFTALVNDGGFCCSTEICVTIPDCTPAALPSDLDGDGMSHTNQEDSRSAPVPQQDQQVEDADVAVAVEVCRAGAAV